MGQEIELYQQLTDQEIYCEKYNVSAKFFLQQKNIYIMFRYNGQSFQIPFHAVITEQTYEWMVSCAELLIESAIEEYVLESIEIPGGVTWGS